MCMGRRDDQICTHFYLYILSVLHTSVSLQGSREKQWHGSSIYKYKIMSGNLLVLTV